MSKKNLLLFLTVLLLSGCQTKTSSETDLSKTDTISIIGADAAEGYKKAEVLQVSYQGEKNKTVFDLLQKKTKVEFEKTDFGVMVTSIDHFKNDPKNKLYWIYYVNDKMADVAADKYVTKEGDEIVWKYEGGK